MNWKCNCIPLKEKCSLRRVDSIRFKPIWFSKRHSIETLLTSMFNKLVSSISHQQACCPYLLDMSATFDTINHNILLERLLPGSVLLTLLSSGFNPISLLALSPLRHRKHHPNHTHSPVVFRKVQFVSPSCLSTTLLYSVHS